jgi:hypothetical protein
LGNAKGLKICYLEENSEARYFPPRQDKRKPLTNKLVRGFQAVMQFVQIMSGYHNVAVEANWVPL